jgi:hypothetical protein
MTEAETNYPLSIVIAIVSGKAALDRCLEGIYDQANEVGAEIIIPYDQITRDALALAEKFPRVRFVEVPYSEALAKVTGTVSKHIHYDLRRAAGLAESRGRVIALTEDYAVPADDWCRQIIRAHEERKGAVVIGGAVENGIDSPYNWAWYYCDFGRYGRPLTRKAVEYVSDVNLSYKRDAIMGVRELWKSGYHETTVHWALSRSGGELCLDERLVVFQHRNSMPLSRALLERIEWGRTFAETRAAEMTRAARLLLVIGSPILPFILFSRAVKNMRRQGRPISQICRLSFLIFAFVSFWSLGEVIGYLMTPVADQPERHVETPVSSTL